MNSTTEKNLLREILDAHPEYFDSVLKRKIDLNVQVIYTQIDRSVDGKANFTDHFFNVDNDRYFYPASTVKFPVAVLALQKLNELNIRGLDKNSTMITGEDGNGQTAVQYDSTAPGAKPTIAHYIRKILLVSDNDAFNRLYEFLGQEYINNALHQMGYKDIQIIHRLDISRSEEQNRHTNPVKFYDANGRLVYEKPAEMSKLVYASRDTKMGKGYMKNGELINEPFDFSMKNRMSLPDLHSMIKAVMFPDAVPDEQRFRLKKDDYNFLRRYMSMLPGESSSPVHPAPEYWDNYVKMIYYGSEKTAHDPNIRIFNKTGTAYGYLIDAAYFVDFKNNIEFLVSAVIYCNSDGIFNDDKYDYSNIGHPFLKNLGRVIYDYELKRKKTGWADLSPFKFSYE